MYIYYHNSLSFQPFITVKVNSIKHARTVVQTITTIFTQSLFIIPNRNNQTIYLFLSLPSWAAAGYPLLSFLSLSFCLFQLHHGSSITQYVLLHLACYTKQTSFRSVPIVAQVKFLFFSEGEGCSLARTRSTLCACLLTLVCCPSVGYCDSAVTNSSVQISPQPLLLIFKTFTSRSVNLLD